MAAAAATPGGNPTPHPGSGAPGSRGPGGPTPGGPGASTPAIGQTPGGSAHTSGPGTPKDPTRELAGKLAGMSNQQAKQVIGEKLFVMIQHRTPQLAGKITGMLLEMDNTELLMLLEDNMALTKKVNEAVAVLRDHHQKGAAE